MTLRVVGAGVGRTGTMSLKLALERLLGGRCYHMIEVFGQPEHVAAWEAAGRGEMPDWERLFEGYDAAVDWPAAAFWPELSAAFPDAVVVLSTRSDGDAWWRSASETIFTATRGAPDDFRAMWESVSGSRFTDRWQEREAAIEGYQRHNDEVRREVPADRLLEWQPGDGWEPLCAALGLPVPDEPFPHANTTDDFRKMIGLD